MIYSYKHQIQRNVELHTDPTEEKEKALLGCADVAGTDVTVGVTAVAVFAVPCPVKLYKEALQKRRQFTSSNYQKTTEEFVGTANGFFQDFLLVKLV